MLWFIILATVIISAISLIGLVLFFGRRQTKNFLEYLISFTAGSLLVVAFFDLLPEAITKTQVEPKIILATCFLSILFFFLLEKTLHWHHCRCEHGGKIDSSHKKNLIYLNLSGNAMHNLTDGFLVAAAFMLDFHTGLFVTLAVIFHEIPHEISDFSLLLYGGLSKTRAATYNFLIALLAIAGAIGFYFFGRHFTAAIPLMTAFAAGNFIYLATADLIPEIHHQTEPNEIVKHSFFLVLGVLTILLILTVVPEAKI